MVKRKDKCCEEIFHGPLLLVLIGVVWLLEPFFNLEIPIVPVVLIILGLLGYFKHR